MRWDVYDGSKMKNFKQFTTELKTLIINLMMSMMVQRWRISSNSQPIILMSPPPDGCLWWFKDEEFQAIHNIWKLVVLQLIDVYDGSKMKNFKQFTTLWGSVVESSVMSMMVQRWRISSNSQLIDWTMSAWLRCLWWFKDEEFQAIHNMSAHEVFALLDVYDGSKMKNFKLFPKCQRAIWFKR